MRKTWTLIPGRLLFWCEEHQSYHLLGIHWIGKKWRNE